MMRPRYDQNGRSLLTYLVCKFSAEVESQARAPGWLALPGPDGEERARPAVTAAFSGFLVILASVLLAIAG